jgi:hypothetical protein
MMDWRERDLLLWGNAYEDADGNRVDPRTVTDTIPDEVCGIFRYANGRTEVTRRKERR